MPSSNNNKTNLLLICGGQSPEHQISLISAKNVLTFYNSNQINITLVVIDRNGNWFQADPDHFLKNKDDSKKISIDRTKLEEVFINPSNNSNQFIYNRKRECFLAVDIVFPLLHGPKGEDGSIQGLFALNNIPFIGSHVLGSALGMDKDISKKLMQLNDIPVTPSITAQRNTFDLKNCTEQIKQKLKFPVFVKPANMGSSIGVEKVDNELNLAKAVEAAFKYDSKVLIEKAINGRELEISVLESKGKINLSCCGEIVSNDRFYSYEAKYIDEGGAKLIVPAEVANDLRREIERFAREAFQVLELKGLARIDFFLTDDGSIFINEVNTLPGFTPISMYPRLWEKSGVNYPDLIQTLIDDALS
jgi:D-alanine-D-alanine ligase